MKPLPLAAVIQNHIKTSRKRNDQLMQIFVGVPAALRSAGNVIKIVNALDVKGHMPAALDEGEIASRISDFGKVNDLALGQAHEVSSSTPACSTAGTRFAFS